MLLEETKIIIQKVAQYADTKNWALIKREIFYWTPIKQRYRFSRRKSTGEMWLNTFEKEVKQLYEEITGTILKVPRKKRSAVYDLPKEQVIEIKERLQKTENWHKISKDFKITFVELRKIYDGILFGDIKISENKSFSPKNTSTEVEKPNFCGEKHPNAKLTMEDVVEIKKRLSKGEMPKEIRKDYNVSQQAIEAIKYGKKWKIVPWPEN